jgi:hypothetical protein
VLVLFHSKAYETDPLICPKYEGEMRMISFIDRPDGVRIAKYLQRSCPKCNGYLGIVVPEGKGKKPVQAINVPCLKCGYRLAWVLVLGNACLAAIRLILSFGD